MTPPALNQVYVDHPFIRELDIKQARDERLKITLQGLIGSSISMAAASYFHSKGGRHLFILPEKEEAAYFYNDLLNLAGEENVLFFPSSYKKSVQYWQTDNENVVLRTTALNKANKEENLIIVTYPDALAEKVISQVKLQNNTLNLKTGDNLSIEFIEEVLQAYHFQLVDFVYEPGQYSIRGSIVDIFSYSNPGPYRVDFFGDEIDSIRPFEIDSQLSKDRIDSAFIVPNVQDSSIEKTRETFLDFLDNNYTAWGHDLKVSINQITRLFDNTDFSQAKDLMEEELPDKNDILVPGFMILEQLGKLPVFEYGTDTYYQPDKVFEFNTSPQPLFRKNFELLGNDLIERTEQGYTNYILSENERQFERLKAIFNDINQKVAFEPVKSIIHQGFIDHQLKKCFYTDHQIFDRYHKYRVKKNFSRKESFTIKELGGLHPGDYVVHIDHGIGKFGGLEKIEVSGTKQEAVRLLFKDNDVLYVSIHSLHKISKYKGKDAEAPKIYKLGTGTWQKLKQKTKKKVKDIAKELIQLYAKRKEQEGFAFSADTYLQKELESSFIFEDTPDQEKATAAFKQDMESSSPMDRLICGDVGFGKTEVAIRAAFKAVTDSKQVAVLVPTTILALQHYNTFSERLKDYPCNIEYISRLKKTKDQKEVIKSLEKGTIDIVIGTHKLVGKDIKFKNLGLLIIDEEQKFGVSVKEKLKQLRVNVDTLTMTATPIPRTLQFSLMGARDLSIINTPPPNRHPVVTEVHPFNEDVIKEAIEYEVDRNGQVFFVHNRVQNIAEVEALVNKLCPDVKTVIAHGQMDGPKLESIMLDFIAGDYDVLIGTTIIESGLDIPNANTIIINNAHHFGLSDLHQLRGRVGRSNKKAFCYLLSPPTTLLNPEARRRMRAIEEFSELGSGFNIAMQDLDIRGAGNLLGAEQSGFINDIGFETYHRILEEAMLELRENEFKEFYSLEAEEYEANLKEKEEKNKKWVVDCQIDTDLELLFPESYVYNISERIHLYRELDNMKDEPSLVAFEKELLDRFGALPETSRELLHVVRLRWLAMGLGIEKIVIKKGKMLLYFVSDQASSYYQSATFSKILAFVQHRQKKFTMKELNNKLVLSTAPVAGISQAKEILYQISEFELKS